MSDDERGSFPDEGPVSSGGGSERRGDLRHLACFAAELASEQGAKRSALIRDLSVGGALLLTRAKLEVGDSVTLALFLEPSAEPRRIKGKVVRQERRPADVAHPWARALAIQFDEPVPALADEARVIAERQAAIRGKTG